MKPLVKGKVERLVYNNGFRLLLEQRSVLNSVAATLLVEAGSLYENERNNGVAHFLEHTIFKGSRRFPDDRAVYNTILKWGGDLNAATGIENTKFYFVIPSNGLKAALATFSDVLLNPILKDRDIDRERGVILSEIKTRDEDNVFIAADACMKNLYRGSAIALDPAGTVDSVSAIKRAEVVSFKHRFYTPQNAVLSVVGNFDRGFVVRHVEKTFGEASKRIAERKVGVIRVKPPPLTQYRDVTQLHVFMATKTVPDQHEETVPLVLVRNHLAEWLTHNIREKRGLAYSVRVQAPAGKHFGYFSIYVNIRPDKFTEVKKIVETEINKLARHGVSGTELKKRKRKAAGNFILDMESNSMQSYYLCVDELLGGYELADRRLEQFRRVTTADTKRVARKYLRPESFVVSTVWPK